jgi:glycosyltransferase involved in cell wall biosynthesis
MKKVLIITEVFPPAFNPRMGYLVKYLPEFGWDADIITNNTVKNNNYKFLVGNNRIVRVNLKHTDTPNGFIQKIWYILNLRKNFLNSRKPYITGMELNFRKDDYSVIIVSVSWELFVLDAAMTISKKWDIPLIVDLRDIHEQKPDVYKAAGKNLKELLANYIKRSFENKKIQLRNEILENAKAVTTVSPFHVEQLLRYNNYVFLIYNGYDSDLFHPNYREKSNIFSIIYTGLVFENEQDPTILFEAVNLLEKEKIINKENFRIQFYTPVNFRSALLNNRCFIFAEKYIDFFDYVDFHEVPRLLQRSSIALVLSNISNNNGPKGVLTTKFFDYLGAERPVLCVRSDEGILENIINNSNIGISARTIKEAHNFILEKWNEWKKMGYTTAKVNQEYKQQFSRKVQARQFLDLFEKVSVGEKLL